MNKKCQDNIFEDHHNIYNGTEDGSKTYIGHTGEIN